MASSKAALRLRISHHCILEENGTQKLSVLSAAAVIVAVQIASAGVCDYKPSAWVGSTGTAAAAATTGAVGGAGAVGKIAGLYSLIHAGSGAAMLGSTAGGASAAATVGIMGGTAAAGAAFVGLIINPLVWIPAAGLAVGTVAVEGGCYLAGE